MITRARINFFRSTVTSFVTVIIIQFAFANIVLAGKTVSRQTCESNVSLGLDNFRIEAQEWVEATTISGGAAGASEVPAHCLFRAVLDPRPSTIEGVSFGTGIEMRLPERWNGRLLFQGGGGLNGVLNPAIGSVPGFPTALMRGFVVVSTDGGHRGRSAIDSSFAADQQAKLDFAYQAVANATREAKALVNHFYGQTPDYSYFMGCSTGGREAMMAAQRSPLEFDGVVSGNASFNLTRVAANQVWSLQTVTRIAPKDATGQSQPYRAFSDEQLKAVSNTVLQQCDALDGLNDGMINDFQSCDFDPAFLSCNSEKSSEKQPCLSDKQITALKDIFGGARNSRGESLYGAYTFDTGIALPAWRGMHLGTETSPPANATLGRDTLRLFAITPPKPNLDPLQFDFDRDMDGTYETAAINDPVATMHTSFVEHGGKMIMYHGLSDQAMSVGALLNWYEKLTPAADGGPQKWARLFLVPGMTHCAGGQATDRFDMLSAIQRWVEEDEVPDRVIASGEAFPGLSRPLCPYPKVARYDGGNEKNHKSFSCR